jgi:predicted outer membrane protein
MATISATAQIVQQFAEQVDTEKAYTLKELKDIIDKIYKGASKPKKIDSPVAAATEKVKRAPSAYNNYVKKRISELKVERPEVPAKELMTIAAGDWKQLSKMEQEQYKA